jgi:hypothetical protein
MDVGVDVDVGVVALGLLQREQAILRRLTH